VIPPAYTYIVSKYRFLVSVHFMKQSTCAWNQIYQIVKENSSVDFHYNNPRDDVMESLLNGTWWEQHGGRRR